MSRPLPPASLIWFYIGAVLGPYGGTTASVLLTTLQAEFSTDLTTATFAVTFYMLAYAGCLLFSGTLSDAFGTRQAVVFGCATMGVGSVLCTVAPSMEIFLVGRVLQGVGNAFTTAILMASLGDLVPGHRLGRALGMFAAFQMAGSTFGPLGGGLAAAVNWRLNFLFMAGLSIALAVNYWRFYSRAGVGTQGRSARPLAVLRGVATPRMVLLCLAAFVGYVAAPSVGFLVAIHLEKTWGVPPAINGFVLAGFGLMNVFAAPKSGAWADRLGRYRMIVMGSLAAAGLMLLEGFMPSAVGFALVFALVGLPAVVTWTALGTLAVEAFPKQRGTATAVFSSAKFAGVAAAPVLLLPIYQATNVTVTFIVVAALTASMILPVLVYGRLTRSSVPGGETEAGGRVETAVR